MNRSDLRLLLDYHYWARDRALDAASSLTPEQFTRDLGSSFRSVRDTLVHAYGAESAWYQRWQGTSPSSLPAADQFPDVASLRNAWTALEGKMRAFLDTVSDAGLDRVYEFKTLAGQSASGILWQMLQHVANHASYHRGQVTTMLRQLGAAPPKSMDMVTFYREHSVVSRD
jgi:uncharacterized damage-inducible protein DinB